MPHLFNLPGPRDGGDTVGAQWTLTGGLLTITADQHIYGALRHLIWVDYSFSAIVNEGTIWDIGSDDAVGALGGYYFGYVTNRGLIVTEATAGNAFTLFAGDGLPSIANYGQMYAIATGNAEVIQDWDPDAYLYNEGTIAAYAPTRIDNGGGGAVGVSFLNGGHIVNSAGGAILAEGVAATAIGLSRGMLIDDGSAQVLNQGRIEAYSLDPVTFPSIAIASDSLEVETMRVVNSGLIRADIVYLSESEYGYSPPQRSPDELINLAGGEMDGLIDTRLGNDSVTNAGTINGNLMMGEGADFVDTRAGVWNGIADLGWGADSFLGSAGDDKVTGNRDADRLEGNGGQDLLIGGYGDDVLIGGAGNDGLYGEYDNDRIVTQGGDVALGGGGDDVIEAGDLAFARIDGGDGFDRLVLPDAPLALDLALVRAGGRLSEIEMIELGGNQRLIVHADDIQPLTGGEKQLELITQTDDRIELIGGWHEAAPTADRGLPFRQFVSGDETLLVNGAATVSILAAPSAPGTGLDPVALGPDAPAIDARTDIGPSRAIENFDYVELNGAETVTASETWRIDQSDGSVTSSVLYGSLTNFGRIESSGRTLWLTNVINVTNHGTIIATGAQGADAVDIQDWGTLFNDGLIEADAVAGYTTAATARGSFGSQGTNFLNSGTISAATHGDRAVGASVNSGSYGANSGLIAAVGGDTTAGLLLWGEAQFVNSGTISAHLAPGASGSTIGVGIQPTFADTQFVNSGLISGDVAILDQTYFPFSVIAIENRGRIEGAIQLGDTIGRVDNMGVVSGDVHLGGGNDGWLGAGGTQVGAVFGGGGDDLILGGADANRLSGEDGDDFIAGGVGADQLAGGAGADIFFYASAADSTAAAFDTIVDFQTGVDKIDLSALGAGALTLTAGDGYTLLSESTATGLLSVHVVGAISLADILTTAPTEVDGTSAADLLHAGPAGATLRGGDGDDLLVGGAGNDWLYSGNGTDSLAGGAGDDHYFIGAASSQVWELPGQGHDTVELTVFRTYYMPDNVEDVVVDDTSFVTGNALSNEMTGSPGDDTFRGGDGSDSLSGGDGNDRLYGDAGADRLTGGAGNDVFVFQQTADSQDYIARADGKKIGGVDIITDFEHGHDLISVADIDATAGDSDQFGTFAFLGTSAFTHHSGELRYTVVGNDAHIYGDVNGDGIADLHIIVQNVTTLAAADFVL